MARILAISSQVARGHIGLSGIVPVLQALGHEVTALPTILLSNHPGHARFAGERVVPEQLARMLETLDANGWLAEVDAVLTGYLPSPGHVTFASDALARVRRHRADAIYVLDPVLGDEPKGLYIAEAAAKAIRAELVPLADTIKLNRFELGWLTGASCAAPAEVVAAARNLGPGMVIVTSVSDAGLAAGATPGHGQLINVAVALAEARAWTCAVERRARAPNGTGDVLGGLLLGYRLGGCSWVEAFGRATAAVDAILGQSCGRRELAVVALLGRLRSMPGLPCVQWDESGAHGP